MKIIFFILTISNLFSCSSKINVESVKVSKGIVESTVTTINSGTIQAKEQAELAFGTVGRISAIKIQLGAIVPQGTIIAEIENADLKAVYDETQKEYERALELFKNGLVSISNLDSAKRTREVARINLEKTIIKAPFKGMITSLELNVGEFYQNSATTSLKPKVQIIDINNRVVKGEIDEIDLNKVKLKQEAKIKIPALKNIVIKGIVSKVVPFVSTAKDQDRTSQIEIELDTKKLTNSLTIPVGASADVEIITDQKDASVIIPTSYLQGIGPKKFVYKAVNDKLIHTDVSIGIGNYERTEITSGLTINDIISRPPEGVDDVSKIKIKAEVKPWP